MCARWAVIGASLRGARERESEREMWLSAAECDQEKEEYYERDTREKI